ncbi:delta-aminolevulinic acid dehydratase [Methyloceanibacter methanicus]|uniref:Delta-aminolevulinic acid dehydratase n=1 Tax=Methyloceanibacter methanicus TaxID=1774968 RepID=A0A1E3W0P0_9HYPH|nr:porphobilinogen synthase [Methyloceanibacter methanicus]ODR99385.1 delta-aminolevulinic acid dehydratase [Methyloceanibacter methanicus]
MNFSSHASKESDASSQQFRRFHRLRSSPQLRDLMRENTVTMNDLIYPIFVEEEIDRFVPIEAMPGIFRIPERRLAREVKALAKEGIKALMLFGVSHHKDHTGSDSWAANGLLSRMVRCAKNAAPEMVIIADCCFCGYTSHGHCGVLHCDLIDNDLTLQNLTSQTIAAANAGADIVAPSAMMDGQVTAIRRGLDEAGFTNLPIMAYSSKFASGFYGPFRAAADCEPKGDRNTYQVDPLNGREALNESFADEQEGADILMVKPGLCYLDVLARLRDQSNTPIAAYQVSGEYAMIKFAAKAGAIDEHRLIRETLGAFKRAGADLILTYFARDIARNGFA